MLMKFTRNEQILLSRGLPLCSWRGLLPEHTTGGRILQQISSSNETERREGEKGRLVRARFGRSALSKANCRLQTIAHSTFGSISPTQQPPPAFLSRTCYLSCLCSPKSHFKAPLFCNGGSRIVSQSCDADIQTLHDPNLLFSRSQSTQSIRYSNLPVNSRRSRVLPPVPSQFQSRRR